MNLIQRIGNHVRRNVGKYAAVGVLGYILTREPAKHKDIVVNAKTEIIRGRIYGFALEDTTESLEPTYSTQYFANTSKGLIAITKKNLYMNETDYSMWNQSTQGYERTARYILNDYPHRSTMAVMVNDTLYPFHRKDVEVSFDGLSSIPLQK